MLRPYAIGTVEFKALSSPNYYPHPCFRYHYTHRGTGEMTFEIFMSKKLGERQRLHRIGGDSLGTTSPRKEPFLTVMHRLEPETPIRSCEMVRTV